MKLFILITNISLILPLAYIHQHQDNIRKLFELSQLGVYWDFNFESYSKLSNQDFISKLRSFISPKGQNDSFVLKPISGHAKVFSLEFLFFFFWIKYFLLFFIYFSMKGNCQSKLIIWWSIIKYWCLFRNYCFKIEWRSLHMFERNIYSI